MQILDNYKLEIFNQLSENFPDKTESIINLAESYCNKEKDFFTFDDQTKAEKIVETIFTNTDIFGDDLSVFLKINQYISLFENNFIDKISEAHKQLEKNPFFHENFVTNKNNPSLEDLIEISKHLNQLKRECTQALLEINVEIKNQISLIKQSSKLTIGNDNHLLKKSLTSLFTKTLETQTKLSELYQDYLSKTILLNKKIIEVNQINETNNFENRLQTTKFELNKIIFEQEKILKKVSEFQLLPIEQLLVFPDYIERFSALILAYSIIKTNICSLEQQVYFLADKDIKLSQIKKLEQNFLDNFKEFINLSIKAFDRGLPSANDKNKTFKNKFIEPIKSRFDSEALKTITLLIDTVY